MKQVESRAKEQSRDLHFIGEQFKRLSHMMAATQASQPLTSLYDQLSQLVHKHADYEAWSTSIFNSELSSWVKHTRAEARLTL